VQPEATAEAVLSPGTQALAAPLVTVRTMALPGSDELPPRLPSLTSLRFVAALMVLVAHSAGRFGFTPDAQSQALQVAMGTAVSFFFVLSGFVLAFNYADLRSGAGIVAYYRARIGRIWPLHLAILAIILLLDPTVARPWVDPTNLRWLPAHAFLVHSWVTLDLTGISAFNAITWTLSTEWFFYLVFPWLMRWTRRWPWRTLLAALALGVGAALGAQVLRHFGLTSATFQPAVLEKCHPFGRLCEFVLGMVVGLHVRMRRREATPPSTARAVALQLAAFGTIALAASQLHRLTSVPHIPVLIADWLRNVALAPLFGWLLVVLATTGGPLVRVLGSPVAERLGDLSYAVYMAHMVVLRQPIWWVVTRDIHPGALGFLLFVLTDLVVAWLLFRFVEVPARAWIRGRQAVTRARIA